MQFGFATIIISLDEIFFSLEILLVLGVHYDAMRYGKLRFVNDSVLLRLNSEYSVHHSCRAYKRKNKEQNLFIICAYPK